MINFPTNGGALSRQSGSAAGFASTISFNCADFLISAAVVSKQTNYPSNGLMLLASEILSTSINLDEEQKKIVAFFEKIKMELEEKINENK